MNTPNRAKTHCPRGHEYTAENTYVSRRRQRTCRTCHREKANIARRGVPRARTPEERFWEKVHKTAGCWLWTADRNANGGYGRLAWAGQIQRAHRVSWEIAFGPVPDGLLVCHHCDRPACVRPDHLFLGTDDDNAKDAKKKGRTARGRRHGSATHPQVFRRPSSSAKLNATAVREVRTRVASGESQCALAREYGIAQTGISKIVLGKTYRHIA